MVLDGLDRRLLAELRQDARLSHRELARRTGSTGPTVAARLERMEDLGVIRAYTVDLDPTVFGAREAHPQAVDLQAQARLACHTCGQWSDEPVWSRIDGRPHPFCCPTCKADFERRFETASKHLD